VTKSLDSGRHGEARRRSSPKRNIERLAAALRYRLRVSRVTSGKNCVAALSENPLGFRFVFISVARVSETWSEPEM
jgi:hypothetical protein